jgi:two-component system cell cycle response regulator DivK
VLFVDDFVDTLAVWEYILELRGFEVLTSTDGLDALQLASTHHPDVIVLDLDLPGKHGLEVARLLGERTDTQHIPLIAVTGHSYDGIAERARASSFSAVFIKPPDPEALLAKIHEVVGQPH